jgi:hypothetical protein
VERGKGVRTEMMSSCFFIFELIGGGGMVVLAAAVVVKSRGALQIPCRRMRENMVVGDWW